MISSLIRAAEYFRGRSCDPDSEHGRASERYRRAALGVVANVVSRGTSLLVLIVSVPLTIDYLGEERFGVWMTIASFAALLSFLDLGIANSLLNRVARAAATESSARLGQLVRNGIVLLLILGSALGLGFALVTPVLPWSTLIRTADPGLYPEIAQSALWFAALFGMGLPLSGISRTFVGLQESYKAHLCTAAASLAALAALPVLAHFRAGIPSLLLFTYGLQALSPILLLPHLIARGLLGLNGTVNTFVGDSRALLKSGGIFFLLQVGGVVAWGSDSLIVASQLGATDVALLAIATRLFQLVTQPLAIANTPLWSAYADASVRRDTAFVARTLARSLSVTFLLSTLAACLLYATYPWVLSAWIGEGPRLPVRLVQLCALWAVLEATGVAFAMFLNGCGVLVPQAITVTSFCLLAIPLKFVLTRELGVEGVITAGLLAYALTIVLPYLTVFRRAWMRHLKS